MIAFITKIDLPLYAQIILIYIFINMIRSTSKRDGNFWLFIAVLAAMSLNNIIEAFGWGIDGLDGKTAYYGNWLLKSLNFTLHSLPSITWAVYIDYQLFGDWEKVKRRLKFYVLPLVASLTMVLLNPYNHFVFTIDVNNIYTRSVGAYIIVCFSYVIVIGIYITSRRYKKMVNGRVVESVFWFTLLPVVSGSLQLFLVGISLLWPSFILAVLITYVLVEKENRIKDALTGLMTRGQLEERLAYKIKHAEAFGLILMDMNHFKDINDTFGHSEGDEALQNIALMMRTLVDRQDMVCRYGGDEFVLLIESLENSNLPSLIKVLDDGIKTYNKTSGKPYKLSMSFGGVFVEESYEGDLQDILTKADERMYRDKAARKSRFLGDIVLKKT